jgi:T5SS/PEP-CTERM-associated repeat protein
MILAAGLALGIGLAQGAGAQTLSWNDANGGLANDPTNWTPNGVPSSSSNLIFNIASALSTIPVTFNATANKSGTMTFRQESYTLTMTSPHTTTTDVIIGSANGDNATVVLTTGEWSIFNTLGGVTIGGASGATGTFTINDDDAVFIGDDDTKVGQVGSGTLNIIGGGRFVNQSLVVGLGNANGTGTVNVSGQLALPPFTRSRLECLGSASIGSLGHGTLNVTNGALVSCTFLFVSPASTGSGTVTIQSKGKDSASIQTTFSALVGRNLNNSAAANGTLNVNTGGLLDVNDVLYVGGDPEGGVGTIHLENDAIINTKTLDIGIGGTLDLDGGTLTVDGGSMIHSKAGNPLVLGGVNNPTLRLANNAASSLSGTSAALIVGGASLAGPDVSATLNVLTGSDLAVTNGAVMLGALLGDSGTVVINGAGSLFDMNASETLVSGVQGNGALQAVLGATAKLGVVQIGLNVGANGLVSAEQSGTSMTTNAVFVGGSNSAAGGTGLFRVLSGATTKVFSTLTDGVKVWPDGTLAILDPGSALSSNKAVRISGGTLQMSNGAVLSAPLVALDAGSTTFVVTGGPAGVTIDAPMQVLGFGTTVSLGADLTVGDASDPNGYTAAIASSVDLHGHTLTILDADTSSVGVMRLASSLAEPGGTIIAPAGISMSGCTIEGHGTVDAAVSMSIAASNAIIADAMGIAFEGLLNNQTGKPITGPVSFVNGGSYLGSGTIAGAVNADAAATITASNGSLTLGSNTPNGVTLNGTLKCGGNTVTLIDSNGVGLGAKTEIVNGTLGQSISLGFGPGEIFQGMGTVDTSLFFVNGNLKPGDTGASGPDTKFITCTGDIQIGAQTNYLCHLGPPGLGEEFPESDRIQTTQVGDVVQINGGTLDVKILPGYTPSSSDFFDVVIGKSGVTGFFDTHLLPPGARISYLSDRVRIHFCYPDCDGDAALTIDDFICFQTEFALDVPTADCDGDSVLSIDDFICFQTYFAVGC